MLGISLVFYKSNEAEYWRVDHLKNKQFAQKTFLVQKIIMHQFWWEAKLCTAFWKHLPKSIKKLKFTGKIGTIYDVITKTFCNECPFQVAISQLAVTCSKLAIETLKQRCEICSKLTIKPPKRRHLRRFDDFNVNFEHISHLCSNVSIVNFKQVNAGWAKYCPLIYMCCGRSLNNKMYRLYEWYLRIVYSDKRSNFKELLKKDSSYSPFKH